MAVGVDVGVGVLVEVGEGIGVEEGDVTGVGVGDVEVAGVGVVAVALSVMEVLAVVDTLPASSLNHAYIVFVPSPLLRVNETLAL